MNHFFAYIRVSTARQGEQGVSLQQQREAIERYAQRNSLLISQWFEEKETAAKAGRPVFTQMLKLLSRQQAAGVIMHKIDRSARNLKDWANLGELIDQGADVHFANESLDLRSRGGRLSADIQAVVAADYIRNLREETKKGIYGRLKQGLYPMPAPVGYLNVGKGQPKQPDPKAAPMVRQLFEMYGTAQFNLKGLRKEAAKLGLTGRFGKPLALNGLSKMLNNPFYTGLIHIAATNETYQGIHEPIISRSLFGRVQDVLAGRLNVRALRHDFLFRRRLTCKLCGYSLIGETHKGFIYYRCQIKDCPTTCVREEAAEAAVLEKLQSIRPNDEERSYFWQEVRKLRTDDLKHQEEMVKSAELQLAQFDERLNRLTDAYIDRLLEKPLFEQRKSALLTERANAAERLKGLKSSQATFSEQLATFLERAEGAYLAYKSGNPAEKRELVDTLTSNRLVDGKSVEITLVSPFAEMANREKVLDGSATENRTPI